MTTTASNELIFAGIEGFFRVGLEFSKSKKKKPFKTLKKIGEPLGSGRFRTLAALDDRYYLAVGEAEESNFIVDSQSECAPCARFGHVNSKLRLHILNMITLHLLLLQKWSHVSNVKPTSKVLAAASGPDNTLIVAKEDGSVEIFKSEMERILHVKLEAKLVCLLSTQNPHCFLGGTDTGYLVVFKITAGSLEIIDSTKLFASPLSSLGPVHNDNNT